MTLSGRNGRSPPHGASRRPLAQRAGRLLLALALASAAWSCRREETPPLASTLPAGISLFPASASATLPVLLVLDSSGWLCSELQPLVRQERHLVCDSSPQEPEGKALREGLRELKRQLGPRVQRAHVWLVAAPDHAGAARALVSQEPSFFSHLAVWTGATGPLAGLFGPPFLGDVAARGARRLVLVGADPAVVGAWSALAGRRGLTVLAAPATSTGDPGGLARVLELLARP